MNRDAINGALGEKLEVLRKRKKYSQEKLGNEIGLSRTSIVNIEKGRHQPSLTVIYDIANIYGESLDSILPTIDEIKDFESRNRSVRISDLNEKGSHTVTSFIHDK